MLSRTQKKPLGAYRPPPFYSDPSNSVSISPVQFQSGGVVTQPMMEKKKKTHPFKKM